MKYETILFDLDDTLFDFVTSEKNALSHAFQAFDLPAGLAGYHGSYREISKGLWSELEQGKMNLSDLGVERFKRLFQEYGLQINAETFNRTYLEFLGKEAHLIHGAEELCHQFQNRRLVVITNGFQEVQWSRIKRSPLHNTFDYIITSEEAGFQKPEKGIFDFVFSKLKISDKNKVLMVGDSLTSDIQGGINYGIDTCWFNRHRQENHTDVQPNYEIYELKDLIEVV